MCGLRAGKAVSHRVGEFLGVVFACQIWGVRVRMFSFLMQGISRLRSARSSRGRVFWDSRVRLVLFLMQGISRLTLEMTSCSLGLYNRPYLSAQPTVGRFALGPPLNVQLRAGN